MSSDILSKAFTTTRRLELEYRKISHFARARDSSSRLSTAN